MQRARSTRFSVFIGQHWANDRYIDLVLRGITREFYHLCRIL